jgi:hypothetical protein
LYIGIDLVIVGLKRWLLQCNELIKDKTQRKY